MFGVKITEELITSLLSILVSLYRHVLAVKFEVTFMCMLCLGERLCLFRKEDLEL